MYFTVRGGIYSTLKRSVLGFYNIRKLLWYVVWIIDFVVCFQFCKVKCKPLYRVYFLWGEFGGCVSACSVHPLDCDEILDIF